jgi:uncharacterized protein with GYD domain
MARTRRQRIGAPPSRSSIRLEETMATFISLINLTDQGARNVKDSPDRFEAFRAMAEQMGLKASAYWTLGGYDMVVNVEGSEEAATAAMLKTATLGNVRSQTMRAFSSQEMRQIIAKMP